MRYLSKKSLMLSIGVVLTFMLAGCANVNTKAPSKQVTSEKAMLTTYADIALINYNDALSDAKILQKRIDEFVKKPTKNSLDNAKAAWINSRETYGQTEVFRLSNGPIDAEDDWVSKAYGNLEPQINAWPLDENMIDYTIDADGKRTRGNIIDSKGKFIPTGEDSKPVDVTKITIDVITDLNEDGGEANVASGYHAIEFLLWGQDQDYNNMLKDNITKGAMVAGQRPLSDFTTDKYAKRRLDYLKASTDKLVEDLELVTSAWSKQISTNCDKDATGCYRGALLGALQGNDKNKNIPSDVALKQIFAGMGIFIKSELANERIAVAVLTPSEEDEHSCFSDNTHRDLLRNYDGFKNVLMGEYNGKKYGAAPFDNLDKVTKDHLKAMMASIEEKINSIDHIAKTSRHFDYQIYPTDPQSKVITRLKNELRKLGDEMVNVAAQNGISLTVEDVTDPEETKI